MARLAPGDATSDFFLLLSEIPGFNADPKREGDNAGFAVFGELVGGADVAGLKRLGVPVTEFQQDATRYFDLHHSADDTLDKVDPKELAQNVAVWTAFVYTVADSDIDFRKTATVSK